MRSEKKKDPKILEELRKTMSPEEKAEEEWTYTFRQYTIDGRRYSTLADLQEHNIKTVTPEETTIVNFVKMLTESGDPKTREFARTIKNIVWLHRSGGDELAETPLYRIVKEVSDKVLATRPGSVERDLFLITAIEQIKTAYRELTAEGE